MLNILLVEANYKTQYAPLGLMKISSYHKQNGDKVSFFKDWSEGSYFGHTNNELESFYDIIYITSLFTFKYKELINTITKFANIYPKSKILVGGIAATLITEKIQSECQKLSDNIYVWVGLLDGREIFEGFSPDAEQCSPDYSLFPGLGVAQIFTTRGCSRNCNFCAVKKHEPTFTVKDWINDYNGQEKITFWDNNWFEKEYGRHGEKGSIMNDVDKLIELKEIGLKNYDFNQGLDARYFKKIPFEEIVKIKNSGLTPLRFAFDTPYVETDVVEAMDLAIKAGFKDIVVYVLYNSDNVHDTPESFYKRTRAIIEHGGKPFPMRFRPLDNTGESRRIYLSEQWKPYWGIVNAISLITMFFYKGKGGIIGGGLKNFLEIFKNTPEEFIEYCKYIAFMDRCSKTPWYIKSKDTEMFKSWKKTFKHLLEKNTQFDKDTDIPIFKKWLETNPEFRKVQKTSE